MLASCAAAPTSLASSSSTTSDPEDASKTLYNAYLFKSPGMLYWIREKAHGWGVDKLNGIIDLITNGPPPLEAAAEE